MSALIQSSHTQRAEKGRERKENKTYTLSIPPQIRPILSQSLTSTFTNQIRLLTEDRTTARSKIRAVCISSVARRDARVRVRNEIWGRVEVGVVGNDGSSWWRHEVAGRFEFWWSWWGDEVGVGFVAGSSWWGDDVAVGFGLWSSWWGDGVAVDVVVWSSWWVDGGGEGTAVVRLEVGLRRERERERERETYTLAKRAVAKVMNCMMVDYVEVRSK